MTKKIIISVISVCLLLIIAYKINSSVKIVDFSSIKVLMSDNLNKEKVEIRKGFYSINRENDLELFYNEQDKIVYANSRENLRTTYGENDFLVIYDNKYYFQFRNFVYDENESIDYDYKFYKKGNEIWLNILVNATEKKIDHKMNLISNAGKLRCNSVINNSKIIYNGVELNKK